MFDLTPHEEAQLLKKGKELGITDRIDLARVAEYEATAADLEDFAVMKLKGFGLTEEQANAIVRYYDVELLNVIAWYDEKEAEGYFRARAAEEHRNQADVVMSDEVKTISVHNWEGVDIDTPELAKQYCDELVALESACAEMDTDREVTVCGVGMGRQFYSGIEKLAGLLGVKLHFTHVNHSDAFSFQLSFYYSGKLFFEIFPKKDYEEYAAKYGQEGA